MNLKTTLFSVGLIFAGLSLQSQTPGSLDTSFGTNGKVLTNLYGYQEIFDTALQSDGKIISVGRSKNGNDYNFCIFRHNVDGSLDTSFGTNGGVVIDIKGNADYDEARAVVVQPDDKIIVGGSAGLEATNGNSHFALVRLNVNGTLDSTFGTGGITSFIVGSDTSDPDGRIYKLKLQADGKILAAGSARNTTTFRDFALVRLLSNGALDSDFSNDGKVTVDFGYILDRAVDFNIEDDGKITVVGDTSSDVGLARFFDYGSLDTSYGTSGKITVDNGSTFIMSGAAFQPDGKVLVLGNISNDLVLRRLNTDGTFDATFGTAGSVTTDIDNSSSDTGSTDLLVQPDGNIIVTALCNTGGTRYFGILRYTGAGTLDPTFSNDGIVLTNFLGGANTATSALFQNDGKLVIGGFAGFTGQTELALARYYTGISLGTPTVENATVKVYPNPTSGILNIQNSLNSLASQKYSVVDQLGRVVANGTFMDGINNQINLSTLNSGVYHIVLQNTTIKIVKQ
ncbi:T9SS type A sorting domain-containing protein [Subsaxibacter sp. CAU 1640]|uniref:T9SS type A sorting domain-containing protein n=1 Tax=Subsaxibacter sp. CAU 1640 TaxID=2933271 RepID=UPI0020032BD4|nr:T9SS type A sorting domain-containing protein [Subsaxibacter sp. CAU 1640]MCK7591246.1 T9SS type A sorting domain-containing protein [Subsaxibacter sp. CAU 1640]